MIKDRAVGGQAVVCVGEAFFSPLSNSRTDEYGGPDMKNRARFPLEIQKNIRDAVGENMVI